MINRHNRQKGINKLDDAKYTNKDNFQGFDTVENDFSDTHFKMSNEKSQYNNFLNPKSSSSTNKV